VSRSQRAWTKSCALLGAVLRVVGGLSTNGREAGRRVERVKHTNSSLPLFTWVTTGMMLVLALTPAVSLGKAGTPHHAVSAARGASKARATTRSPSSTPDPHQSGGDTANTRRSRAEVLAPGAGYATKNGSTAVRALQRRLISLGYAPGPLDGSYGPLTTSAVIRFQAGHGLRADGIVGPLTLAALGSAGPILYPGEGYGRAGSQAVRNLQRKLAAAGYGPGAIDGRYGPRTEHAVMRYQASRHLHVDGIAGPQTLSRLRPMHTRTDRPSGQSRSTRPNGAPRPNGATRPNRAARTKTSSRLTPRPNSSPAGTAHPARAHQKTGSGGGLPIASIVLLACLLSVLLVAAVRRRPRAADGQPDLRRRAKAPQFRRGVRARRAAPELAPTPVNLPEHAAEQLNDRAANSDDEQRAGAAAFRLGLLLTQDGNLVGAEDAFRRADERGHPGAAFELALLLMQEGDRDGAKGAFRRADERGHAEAAFNLGVLLAEEGGRAGAKAAFRRAVERDHPDAAFNLGALLLQEGDLAGAEEAFRNADQRGDAGAACNLGVLLEQRGDRAGAEAAYRRADDRGHSVGACNLGLLLESEGDVAGAREAYRRADSRGDPLGSYSLGLLLEREGDRESAKEAYRRADKGGNPEAACNLGFLLKEEGDRAGALQAFKRAGEQGSQEVAEVAQAEMLALTAREEGER
jgi:peptidoglycan hydrolase-like protein with peptidoglycan-binding domain/tetratricopeptide (TPR) repeat protein